MDLIDVGLSVHGLYGGLKSLNEMLKACFAAGTVIKERRRGWLPIEELRAGDEVWARPEAEPTSAGAWKHVEEIFVRTAPVMRLRVGGRDIWTTGEHPFWERWQGWVPAAKLQEGDELSGSDGEWTRVEQVEDKGEVTTVYNCRVADFHTYFVGGTDWGFDVWAHNSCEPANRENIDYGNNRDADKSTANAGIDKAWEAANAAWEAIQRAPAGAETIEHNGYLLRVEDDTPVNGGRGPAAAAAVDLDEMNAPRLGQNQPDPIGFNPGDDPLHPLLLEGLDRWAKNPENVGKANYTLQDGLEGARSLPQITKPASHAEVEAVNRALWARQQRLQRDLTADDLGRIAVAAIRTQDKTTGLSGEPFDRCEVCAEMLRGVITYQNSSPGKVM